MLQQEFSEFIRAGIGYTNQYIIPSVAQGFLSNFEKLHYITHGNRYIGMLPQLEYVYWYACQVYY